MRVSKCHLRVIVRVCVILCRATLNNTFGVLLVVLKLFGIKIQNRFYDILGYIRWKYSKPHV